ncbi:Fic family protein [Collinsella tanakaei]|uniref:Fic family protein n=1 Tax=Collinsella tanakaei TaxID=626935 RepID=UPI001957C5FA|nr:DNA-binding protein [Collinsella tanakaei]MBM6755329.1 Fic family protein [Collinsella tanakaei]
MALTVAEMARRWGVSERTVRAYCAEGRIPGAELIGKTWAIPEDAEKPARRPRSSSRRRTLLEALREEKDSGMPGGIYHHIQIELTYNSNHIEGSRLSHEQTRFIFETNTLGVTESVRVDDIVETANHFRCIDMVIDAANRRLSERMIKSLHAQLKQGTTDSRKSWFAVGDYKRLPNEAGGRETTPPEHVAWDMSRLIAAYEAKSVKTFEDIVAFHTAFEAIHPFQDGNGRVGRLVMFKECLRCGVTPFIITDEMKLFYYRGLSQWNHEPGYLLDTCRAAQDAFGELLARFRIEPAAG